MKGEIVRWCVVDATDQLLAVLMTRESARAWRRSWLLKEPHARVFVAMICRARRPTG
ncbi:MAG: hypothetical protein ACREQ5_08375 [Candidatus Dormibacteria bacterium]